MSDIAANMLEFQRACIRRPEQVKCTKTQFCARNSHDLFATSCCVCRGKYDFECNLELICTSEFFKKYQNLTSPQGELNLNFLKKSRVQINFKLNEKRRMITYF